MRVAGWADHACRFCWARLYAVPVGADGVAFECGNCGRTAADEPDAICGCGAHLGARPNKRKPPSSGPRFRCAPNPAPSMENPAAIVIVHGDTRK